ncbi:efflux RND transporter periplasmic adaptor subunit [Parerythrobacter lacustris]|uniref:Efflux RND transporter periplasmic adaptor subunit n=1 Tax=Parerythrobacter lacustris TaxID=2969984 RepID=A0ABT1XTZ0_9SPHN|nr:efflux RND transporter periplasmic adaptor subunit [Parerythrobacter lacustris]MCR2834376.1 efflux RND transporter periplasmic adaptor subunit [Parerythrobacter lacustris]
MNYETTVRAESGETFDSVKYDGESSSKGKRRLFIILAILLALVIGGGYWAYSQRSGATTTPAGDRDQQAPVVSVITPGVSTIAGEITATGTLAARRELPVGVAGEGGRVVSVPVDAGDWVRAGQVLVVIDRSVQNQQVLSSTAQVDVARADAQLAQANLDRALKLVERGFISQADVDRLTATRDAATARVRVAQAQVGELRARNARLNVIAPASGYVLERNVELGQIVSAGSPPLFRIAQGGEMELEARLGEDDLAQLATGVEAVVVPAGTTKEFIGQVWQLAPTIDPNSRQGTARIALSYAPGLRPGGFATATIKSGTLVAPRLPESAVLSDDTGSYVYVVDKDNKVVRRNITLGSAVPGGIIVTKGLTGKERIVIRAGGFLNPGETVKPQVEKSDDL